MKSSHIHAQGEKNFIASIQEEFEKLFTKTNNDSTLTKQEKRKL
jgi:hypothetical protein